MWPGHMWGGLGGKGARPQNENGKGGNHWGPRWAAGDKSDPYDWLRVDLCPMNPRCPSGPQVTQDKLCFAYLLSEDLHEHGPNRWKQEVFGPSPPPRNSKAQKQW